MAIKNQRQLLKMNGFNSLRILRMTQGLLFLIREKKESNAWMNGCFDFRSNLTSSISLV